MRTKGLQLSLAVNALFSTDPLDNLGAQAGLAGIAPFPKRIDTQNCGC